MKTWSPKIQILATGETDYFSTFNLRIAEDSMSASRAGLLVDRCKNCLVCSTAAVSQALAALRSTSPHDAFCFS